MFDQIQPSIRRRAADPLDDSLEAVQSGAASASVDHLLRLQQAALESTANSVVITDHKGTILWTNPAFTALTGYTAAEALGKTPRILKSGSHERSFYQGLWRTILDGQTWRGEFTNRRKDGSLYHGEQVITPVRDGGGITHFVGVMNDITARRQAEVAQREAHQQLEQLLSHSPAVIYGLKWENERIVPHRVSENVTRLLGFTVAETMSYEWWLSRLHPDDQERAVASIAETLTHETSRAEYRLRHRDGTYRWVEDNRRLFRDASGQPAEMIGVWTDLTERKQAEEVLRHAAAQRSGEQRNRVLAEVGLMAVAALLVFWGGNAFGWFEWIISIVADRTAHPLADETIAAIAILLPCLGLFSFRRWRESRAEAFSQQHIAAALRTLRAELEDRIHERTGELAQANRVLRGEVAERTRVEEALRESEERIRLITETVDEVFWMASVDIKETAYISLAYERIWGRSLQSLRDNPRSFLDAVHPEDLPQVLAGLEAHKTGRPFSQEFRIIRPTGTIRWIKDSGYPVRRLDGSVTHYVGAARDITQRKDAEAALRQSEERYRALVDAAPTGILVNVDNRFAYVNQALCRIVGAQSPAELIGTDVFERIHPDSHPSIRERIAQGLAGASVPLMEQRYLRLDGSAVNVETLATPSTYQGRPAIQVLVNDITERKRAAEALLQAQQRYQAIFENALEGIYQSTPTGRLRTANPAMARILGYASPEELIAEAGDIEQTIHVDPRRQDEFKHALAEQGFVTGFESEVYRRDRSKIWVSGNARVVRDEEGSILCYEGSMEDISERKRGELRLRLQQSVTEVLAEGSSLVRTQRKILETIGRGLDWDFGEFWLMDRASRLLSCVETWHPPLEALEQFKVESRQMQSAPGSGLVGRVATSGQVVASLDLARDAGCPRRQNAGRAGLSGWIGFPVTLRGKTLGVVGFFTRQELPADEKIVALLEALGAQIGQFIEREDLAEQFHQAQKMEAIGTLAGGIAHDFNNILAAIAGYTELAKMELGGDSGVIEHLNAVLTGSARATSLVRQILAFSRQQQVERKPLQLRYVVQEALDLLRATIPATIEFEFMFERDLPLVLADATQVHQVVMNLGTNAWHAMKDRPGRLGLRLDPCRIDAKSVGQYPGLRVGNYVCLAVSDTGHGMDRATLSRIFDPFFTTKAPGEGTGLGLAVVHGIMQAHEGVVTVQSQPGEGTVFRLYFPAVAAQTAEVSVDATGVIVGHGERVMVVDDEQALAFISRKILERLGYVVDAHVDPREALEAVRADPTRYDLVITDLAMPGMSGTDLAQELWTIRPNLPVILTTGHAANLTLAGVRTIGVRELLSKPISVHAIGTVVARVLAETKPD